MAKMMRPEAEVTRFGGGIDVIATSGANNPGPITLSGFNDETLGNGRVEYMGNTYADMKGVQDATGFFNITFSESKEDLYEAGKSTTLDELFLSDSYTEQLKAMPYDGVYRWYETYSTLLFYSKK